MPKIYTAIGITAIICAIIWYSAITIRAPASNPSAPVLSPTPQLASCTPAFRDGGGPYYLPDAPFRRRIAPDSHNRELLTVRGKILQKDCITPASGLVLDIWQANENGEYVNDWYRGKVLTGTDGSYEFTTVIPKGYGQGTGYRPPHIHFKVWDNNTELVTSQIFFPQIRGTAGFDDAYIMAVDTRTDNQTVTHSGSHTIILP